MWHLLDLLGRLCLYILLAAAVRVTLPPEVDPGLYQNFLTVYTCVDSYPQRWKLRRYLVILGCYFRLSILSIVISCVCVLQETSLSGMR